MVRIPLLHNCIYEEKLYLPSYVEARAAAKEVFFMQIFMKNFSDSAKEFKNLKSLVTAALLVALHTVFAFFLSVQVTDSLRISVSFLVNVVIGSLFGPVMGFVCGGVGDVIQFVLKPTGPYFAGWTLSAALAGLIYGSFFYQRFPSKMEEKTAAVVSGGTKKILRTASVLLPALAAVLWFAAPFVTVADKADGSILAQGSALSVLRAAAGSGAVHNAAIVAGILIVLLLFLLFAGIPNWNAVPLTAAVLCCSACVLAVYTDKKTTTVQWGFWLITALLVLYMAVKVWQLSQKHAVDLRFMLRCVLVLVFDTILVNVLLGTYWVTVMYGKGFAFYFTTRLVKNLIQLPINIILTYYVLGFVKNIKNRI